jgi:hypothetical protein
MSEANAKHRDKRSNFIRQFPRVAGVRSTNRLRSQESRRKHGASGTVFPSHIARA